MQISDGVAKPFGLYALGFVIVILFLTFLWLFNFTNFF